MGPEWHDWYFNAEFSDVAEGDQEGGFEGVEKAVVEGDVLDAKVPTQDFNCEFVVLDAVDVLAELLDHDLLDDGFDH